jgi:DNA-binding NarL/FixJ family response regulator
MKRILVIEDEKHTRENLCTILEMEGYAATAAADGEAGVAAALREPPDLVLCDVSMPGLDGLGVLAALRRDARTVSVPFIFLSARGERLDVRLGMNLGADDYLTKPASASEVLAAVGSRLARAAQQQAFDPQFDDPKPLESLGLTPREAEVLLWVSQGKSNPEIAGILGAAENTVKVHLSHVFEKLGVDNRHAAALGALETLGQSRRAGGGRRDP